MAPCPGLLATDMERCGVEGGLHAPLETWHFPIGEAETSLSAKETSYKIFNEEQEMSQPFPQSYPLGDKETPS